MYFKVRSRTRALSAATRSGRAARALCTSRVDTVSTVAPSASERGTLRDLRTPSLPRLPLILIFLLTFTLPTRTLHFLATLPLLPQTHILQPQQPQTHSHLISMAAIRSQQSPHSLSPVPLDLPLHKWLSLRPGSHYSDRTFLNLLSILTSRVLQVLQSGSLCRPMFRWRFLMNCYLL